MVPLHEISPDVLNVENDVSPEHERLEHDNCPSIATGASLLTGLILFVATEPVSDVLNESNNALLPLTSLSNSQWPETLMFSALISIDEPSASANFHWLPLMAPLHTISPFTFTADSPVFGAIELTLNSLSIETLEKSSPMLQTPFSPPSTDFIADFSPNLNAPFDSAAITPVTTPIPISANPNNMSIIM